MKIILACILSLISSPVFSQWRAIKVSSATDTSAITENFRRASLWSNRKLDRFSNDTLYGQPVFKNGVKFGDGTIQNTAIVSTGSFATSAQLTSTASAVTALEGNRVLRVGDTMTGQLTIQSSLTVSGIAQSSGFITGVSTHTQICLNGQPCISEWQTVSGDESFYISTQATDLAGFYAAYSTYSYTTAYTQSFSASANNVAFSTWTTLSGYPSGTILPNGRYEAEIYANTSAVLGNLAVRLYVKMYKRSAAGTLTLLGTSFFTPELSTSIIEYRVSFTTGSVVLTSGDRIVMSAWYTTSGSGATPTVTMYSGNPYDSHFSIPSQAVSIANFVPYNGATKQLNTGAYGITMSSDIVANAYYGDGSKLTGITSGGVATSTAIIDGSPIGTFIQYGSTTAPSGYLYCDGTNRSTTTYSDLFSIIGYKFGGSGANFTCDFRGMFARGISTEATKDPEFRVVGSTETDSMQGHWHDIYAFATSGTGPGMPISPYGYGTGVISLAPYQWTVRNPVQDGTHGTPRVGDETRPKNVAVAIMVKYAHVGSVSISSTSFLVGSYNTFTGPNTFTGSVTASSFTIPSGGQADVGFYIHTASATLNNGVRAACASGYKAVSGSCTDLDGTYLLKFQGLSTGTGDAQSNLYAATVSGPAIGDTFVSTSYACYYNTATKVQASVACERIK